MTNKPESAAVEAVAVVMQDSSICWLNSWLMSDNYVKSQQGDKLYPQSALDALRGEVERLRSALEAVAWTRPPGPIPSRVPGSVVQEMERIAINALTKESP